MQAKRSLPFLLAAFACIAAPVRADDQFGDLARSLIQPAAHAGLSDSDIGAGLKDALARGTRTAVNELGRSDGYWGNPRFRIPLPGKVEQAQELLQRAGMGRQLDDLHRSFNRAAEQAVPVAADVFAESVRKLTLNDVRGILDGPPNAATEYFKRSTSDTLAARFKPIVARVTAKVGLAQQYNAVMASAGPMAAMLGVDTDLDGYVTRKALDGLFLRVADEEKSIRTNPAARTTDLLRRVFGGKS
jgi:hypothetical protein